jgi:hypothetical protein
MRKLVVALLAVVLAAATFTLSAPADASGFTWHTMLKNRKAQFQACKQVIGYDSYRKQTYYMVWWRTDNRHGHKRASFKENGYDGGTWVEGGDIPRVPPHWRTKPIGNSPMYDTAVINMWSRYGSHRKTGTTTIAAVGLC